MLVFFLLQAVPSCFKFLASTALRALTEKLSDHALYNPAQEARKPNVEPVYPVPSTCPEGPKYLTIGYLGFPHGFGFG